MRIAGVTGDRVDRVRALAAHRACMQQGACQGRAHQADGAKARRAPDLCRPHGRHCSARDAQALDLLPRRSHGPSSPPAPPGVSCVSCWMSMPRSRASGPPSSLLPPPPPSSSSSPSSASSCDGLPPPARQRHGSPRAVLSLLGPNPGAPHKGWPTKHGGAPHAGPPCAAAPAAAPPGPPLRRRTSAAMSTRLALWGHCVRAQPWYRAMPGEPLHAGSRSTKATSVQGAAAAQGGAGACGSACIMCAPRPSHTRARTRTLLRESRHLCRP